MQLNTRMQMQANVCFISGRRNTTSISIQISPDVVYPFHASNERNIAVGLLEQG